MRDDERKEEEDKLCLFSLLITCPRWADETAYVRGPFFARLAKSDCFYIPFM